MFIEIKRPTGDLFNETWRFYLGVEVGERIIFRLESYLVQKRATRRHKFATQAGFFGTNPRASMDPAAIRLPADVVDEARQKICDRIRAAFLELPKGAAFDGSN